MVYQEVIKKKKADSVEDKIRQETFENKNKQ